MYGKVAVIGAGTMGRGLALSHTLAGSSVALYDVSGAVLSAARVLIASAAETLVTGGLLDAAESERVQASITIEPDLATALAGASLIVETVVEDPDVKRAVFADLDRLAPEDAVLTSNSSRLDVFPLVPASRTGHFLIAHWYNPSYLTDLVDVVPHPDCPAERADQLVAYLRQAGKRPVLLRKFMPGYLANRIQSAIAQEVFFLLDNGFATPQQIDDSIRYGLAERLLAHGYLEKCDYTGLELMQRTLANATYTPPPQTVKSPALDALVAAGHTGVMAGAGFYDYGDTEPAELLAERDQRLMRLRQARS
ncbi:3-hydroxyacyl-CoA dehydrogenase family protein [Amycolatopsis acidicola]|uniref:3-hydroxyacyl-CoA dehydrogenase family protein n=1 Tax=Amycolatopsis acidicola TaxID=2596893 RepID=A0A5N0VG83_9PSEU|nr:3-hydroxyacyl-CoA dehydrogenase family protein [Amycolatopsis acidicola]KAA9164403.1 3-hydroxyacyl-CoA dehydrogenase family protein [Amycolatopsis acidicola]